MNQLLCILRGGHFWAHEAMVYCNPHLRIQRCKRCGATSRIRRLP